MGSKFTQPIFFVVTRDEVYRSDLIERRVETFLRDMDRWQQAVETGRIVPVCGDASENDLDEYHAHLDKKLQEKINLTLFDREHPTDF